MGEIIYAVVPIGELITKKDMLYLKELKAYELCEHLNSHKYNTEKHEVIKFTREI
jgi:hypothetical protein